MVKPLRAQGQGWFDHVFLATVMSLGSLVHMRITDLTVVANQIVRCHLTKTLKLDRTLLSKLNPTHVCTWMYVSDIIQASIIVDTKHTDIKNTQINTKTENTYMYMGLTFTGAHSEHVYDGSQVLRVSHD